MQTGIATTIFLVSVVLTLVLYYLRFVREDDPIDFIESNTAAITGTLAVLVIIGIVALGFNIVFLLLAFFLLFFLLLLNR